MERNNLSIALFSWILIGLLACSAEPTLTPKPRMFPRIIFPDRVEAKFSEDYCQFGFSMYDYVEVVQDSNFFEEAPKHPCWFDLKFTGLNSTLHCSYYPIKNREEFDKMVADAFKMAGKHNIKADARNERLIFKSPEVSGILFEIGGPVASPMQFFLTDSTQHFFRGSLYINDHVNPDSTAILLDFLKEDINLMIETFEWKKAVK